MGVSMTPDTPEVKELIPDESVVWKEEQEPVSCQLDAWTRGKGKVPIKSKPVNLYY